MAKRNHKPRGYRRSGREPKCRYWMPELMSIEVVQIAPMTPPIGLAYALRGRILNDGTISAEGVSNERVLVDSPLSEST